MEINAVDLSVIITVIGFLVALTNVITEVMKKVTWDKIPTNLLAIIVAMVLTLLFGFAYLQVKGFAVTWYIVVAFIVLGFLVAYSAMFGFDKLKEIMHWGDGK